VFYAFPDVSGVPIDSQRLADRLLEQADVALPAGAGVGTQGDRHLRMSYARSREQPELALDRIRDFLSD
jgi:aspartate/methionine/tyrosine aminotransferase